MFDELRAEDMSEGIIRQLFSLQSIQLQIKYLTRQTQH